MDAHRRTVSITACGMLLLSMSAARVAASGPRVPPRVAEQQDACTLLTVGDASTALEVTSRPGKHTVESTSTLCAWSDDPAVGDESRRVVLVIVSPAQFKIVQRSTVATVKIEPVSGIGDEAVYQTYPNASPFIWVRKGGKAVSIRILTRRKPAPPFTVDQEKAKLAVLAKAAVAKL